MYNAYYNLPYQSVIPTRSFLPIRSVTPFFTNQTPTALANISGITKKLSLSKILNGANKTLNVMNQAIPLINQAKPMVNNAKTMLRVIKEINKTPNINKTNTKTTSNPNKEIKTIENKIYKKQYNNDNTPQFFI